MWPNPRSRLLSLLVHATFILLLIAAWFSARGDTPLDFPLVGMKIEPADAAVDRRAFAATFEAAQERLHHGDRIDLLTVHVGAGVNPGETRVRTMGAMTEIWIAKPDLRHFASALALLVVARRTEFKRRKLAKEILRSAKSKMKENKRKKEHQ